MPTNTSNTPTQNPPLAVRRFLALPPDCQNLSDYEWFALSPELESKLCAAFGVGPDAIDRQHEAELGREMTAELNSRVAKQHEKIQRDWDFKRWSHTLRGAMTEVGGGER